MCRAVALEALETALEERQPDKYRKAFAEFVKVKDLIDPTWEKYYEDRPGHWYHAWVIAPDEATAQRWMVKKLAELDPEYVEQFITRGKPVRLAGSYSNPPKQPENPYETVKITRETVEAS